VAPLASVPNFSEGRDRSTIDALARALSAHARVLDVHVDPDHNRSVFTLTGEDDALVAALLAAVAVARERIDLRRHAGAHPRVGAADVVPIVAAEAAGLERAQRVAARLAAGIGDLGLPVFLTAPPTRGPGFYRRGGSAELARRIEAGELAPDHGPASLDPSFGAVLVGARLPLVAFNVNLRGPLELARAIAAQVRESGGGFPRVRALGLELPRAGLVQVSLNVEDWQAAPLAEIVAAIEARARAAGAELAGCELVGLMPAGAAAAAAAAALALADFDASRLLELRLLGG
jgi:glutamate formiminotransferase/glutamate formiminotransferase/formiminotetrahydrofolate cyclodeaminase